MSRDNWRLFLGDRCLYYSHATVTGSYTLCLTSGHGSHALWIHQILEDIRRPGRRFHRRVKLLTVGYTTSSVKWGINVWLHGKMTGPLQTNCLQFSRDVQYGSHNIVFKFGW